MAVTQNTYTGDGTTVLFSFTFPYLETTDIKVSLNGTVTTAYTLANATTIQFNTAPANGAAIRIYRQTDDAEFAAQFYPGSAIRSQDLNDNFTQSLYIAQEVVRDVAESVTLASGAGGSAVASAAAAAVAEAAADAATTTANGAVTTANTAVSTANTAVSTANSAEVTADVALATATSAIAAATAAAQLNVAQTFIAVQTFTDPAIIGTIKEDVYTISDAAAFEVDPGNGSVQLITLGASRAPKATNFAAGEAVTLMVNDGSSYSLTWSDTTWGSSGVIWTGGSAPTLATTGYTVIQFWKVGSQVYGAHVGGVA